MRRAVLILIGSFLIIGNILYCYVYEDKEYAKFYIQLCSSFGVFFAAMVALYGDKWRNEINRVELLLALPERVNTLTDIGPPPENRLAYCYHLRVRNKTPEYTVQNCQVWLIEVLDRIQDGTFQEIFKFTVPRLMEWAPSEYSKEKRSFNTDQVFDFAWLFLDNGQFRPRLFGPQGGDFRGDCSPVLVRKYIFQFTADNYIKKNEFSATVEVNPTNPNPTWPYPFRAVINISND